MSETSAGKRNRLLLLLAVVFLAGLMAGSGISGTIPIGERGARASGDLSDQPGYDTLEQTWEMIDQQYVDPSAVNNPDLLYGAAAGMVDALGDYGHSRFMDPEQAIAFQKLESGTLVGIGVQLDVATGWPVVVMVVPDSPAEDSGILPGDVIRSIDDISTNGLTLEEIAGLIRGDLGTPVELAMERPSTGTTFTANPVRSEIELDPVELASLPEGVALLRINDFSLGAGEEVQEALRSAAAAGATSVVLDLRGNPGGYLDEAVRVLEEFLPEGSVLFRERGRSGDISETTGDGSDSPGQDLPVVVLIDANSASAAEVVAAALRDNGRGTLIGETSFGAGTILSQFPLDDGSSVLLGTSEWLTPAGDPVWKKGVKPDQEVRLESPADLLRPEEGSAVTAEELAASGDTQLQAAWDLVHAQAGTPTPATPETAGSATIRA